VTQISAASAAQLFETSDRCTGNVAVCSFPKQVAYLTRASDDSEAQNLAISHQRPVSNCATRCRREACRSRGPQNQSSRRRESRLELKLRMSSTQSSGTPHDCWGAGREGCHELTSYILWLCMRTGGQGKRDLEASQSLTRSEFLLLGRNRREKSLAHMRG
jgi:hypothetical protein